ncbi:DUF6282 family protein [Paenibacillus eucommiae]|uniref:Histidinol phosphatase n=1 Tax=Paenibacillus eucommiae TaxID=1355755 RepID=A0ABS4J6B9_9BACL|nr:DUF6282 family protein [Paenibacillus eucommiae]MBP1995394.1 hypothetical protein [Paenibacillus eucommiae]
MSVSDLMKGALDVHMHAGPSVIPRIIDVVEAVKEAQENGMRALVIKDHQVPMVGVTELVQKHHVDQKGFRVFSGIALNNHIGGLNLLALDTALVMGAKMVWMPTISCENHHVKHAQRGLKFPASKKGSGVQDHHHIHILEGGVLSDQIKKVIDLTLSYEDVVIGTGHGTAEEVDAIINYALSRGAKKIIANHPGYMIDATVEQMKDWASKGVYIEICATTSDPRSNFYTLNIDQTCEIIQQVGMDQIIVSSDYGQINNPRPYPGFVQFADLLLEKGFSTHDITTMIKDNPLKVLNMDHL